MPGEKKIITVFGSTGAQGGGVVKNLLEEKDTYIVRAVTRDASTDKAKRLQSMGCEVVAADLNKPETLKNAFEGAYGTFLVTNFWDPSSVNEENSEYDQAKRAIDAAKEAGVHHFVWSTLPNSLKITDGRYEVKHFTTKALVDELVTAAGFKYYTFIMAPMYCQIVKTFARSQDDGSQIMTMPLSPEIPCVNIGDIGELGVVAAAAFAKPHLSGNGTYYALGNRPQSFGDIVKSLNNLGHNVQFVEAPADETWDSSFPGAMEIREMLSYWAMAGTYYGKPEDEVKYFANTTNLLPDYKFSTFEEWAKESY